MYYKNAKIEKQQETYPASDMLAQAGPNRGLAEVERLPQVRREFESLEKECHCQRQIAEALANRLTPILSLSSPPKAEANMDAMQVCDLAQALREMGYFLRSTTEILQDLLSRIEV